MDKIKKKFGFSMMRLPMNGEEVNIEETKEMVDAFLNAGFPGIMTVLSGMGNMEQMEDNISYMKDFRPLNETEQKALDKAVESIRALSIIPCTACRYCVDTCPKKIAIPDYFAIYNNLKRGGQLAGLTSGMYYGNLTETHGKASECLKCGKCEKLCPQHLTIRKYLEDVAKTLE